MTANLTLEHTKQVKKIANNLTELGQQVTHDNRNRLDYRYNTPVYQHISSLTQQLASVHVYLDGVLGQLYVWARLKRELSIM